MNICKHCIKPQFVQKFFKNNEKKYLRGKCIVCGENRKSNISLDIFEFRNILRAAIRYYYDEDIYNRHLGGEGLAGIFSSKNFVLNHPLYDEAMLEAFANLIDENPDKGISLYCGHIRGIRWQYSAVRSTSYLQSNDLVHLRKRKKWIIQDIKYVESNLDKGRIFFRGRSSYACEKHFPIEGEKFYCDKRVAYKTKKDMGPPPSEKAKGARFNMDGVPYFYLANNLKTIVAELRPELDIYISLGKFKLTKHVKLVDVTSLDYYSFCSSDEMIDRYVLLNDLNNLFVKPINEQTREEYKKTQFIADIIKNNEYDGIVYKSSVSLGKNYCFFDAKQFQFIKESAMLIKVRKIDYQVKEILNEVVEDKDLEGVFNNHEKEVKLSI